MIILRHFRSFDPVEIPEGKPDLFNSGTPDEQNSAIEPTVAAVVDVAVDCRLDKGAAVEKLYNPQYCSVDCLKAV